MIELGSQARPFQLTDPRTNKPTTLDDVRGEKGTLIIFMCNHCPYVIHLLEEIVAVSKQYMSEGIGMIAINSNDVENYPADAPDKMVDLAEELGFDFPYVFDEDQCIAKAYDAACTPDFYIYDAEDKLVYRGRYDESRPNYKGRGNGIPITGEDLRGALDNLLAGKAIDATQYPSMGCNIKWKNVEKKSCSS